MGACSSTSRYFQITLRSTDPHRMLFPVIGAEGVAGLRCARVLDRPDAYDDNRRALRELLPGANPLGLLTFLRSVVALAIDYAGAPIFDHAWME